MVFRKGYRAELELVHLLMQDGFYAIRIPISGGRSFPCDVLASKGEDRRAYEVKLTKLTAYHFYEDDIKPLLEFCQNFNFQAYVAVRWKYKKKNPWTFRRIDEVASLRIARRV